MNLVCVPIARNSAHVIVNAEDFECVARYAWELRNGYAMRKARDKGKRHSLSMHRMIAGAEPGQLVDHINRNKLDNRRENLRIVTPSQNNANQAGRRGLKGAYISCKGFSWYAKSAGQYLGCFKSEQEAARAYDQAARAIYGDNACLNFQENGVS